jgi:hypothetical protein
VRSFASVVLARAKPEPSDPIAVLVRIGFEIEQRRRHADVVDELQRAIAQHEHAGLWSRPPGAIAKFAQEFEVKDGAMAAGAMLSIPPARRLLIVGQRYFVRGLTAGALK